MSKDKGSKNQKKAPANKTGKLRVVSTYKSEGKIGNSNEPLLQVFNPKTDAKKTGNSKSK